MALIDKSSYLNIDIFSEDHAIFNNHIWIGLNDLDQEYVFEWSDGSLFDFGQNGSAGGITGIYPWKPGEPNNNHVNEYCVELWMEWYHTYTWNDNMCELKMRFMCNSCEGQLDKYLLMESDTIYGGLIDYDWHNASNLCNNLTSTALASIHSMEDNVLASGLCQAADENICWIGLSRANDTDTFSWSDQSTYEYGTDVSGGVFPWDADKPSDKHCIEMHGDVWVDKNCNRDIRFTHICNKPSELCYQQQWTILQNANGVSFENCGVNVEDTASAVISNKKWTENNIGLKIEYIFRINYVVPEQQSGHAGLVIYNVNNEMGLCDDFIFIGLVIINSVWTTAMHLMIIPSDLNTEMVATTLIDNGDALRLFISCPASESDHDSDTINCSVSVNGVLITNTSIFRGDKYIGIYSNYASITATSLFISGTPTFDDIDTTSIQGCGINTRDPTPDPAAAPSPVPTNSPTIAPSIAPSLAPTMSPTKGPFRSASIDLTTTLLPTPQTLPETYSEKDSETIGIGIIVAIVLGNLCVLIILALLISCIWMRKKSVQSVANMAKQRVEKEGNDQDKGSTDQVDGSIQERGSESIIYEPGSVPPSEPNLIIRGISQPSNDQGSVFDHYHDNDEMKEESYENRTRGSTDGGYITNDGNV